MKEIALFLALLMLLAVPIGCQTAPDEPVSDETSSADEISSAAEVNSDAVSFQPEAVQNATLTAEFADESAAQSHDAICFTEPDKKPEELVTVLVQTDSRVTDLVFFKLDLDDEGLFVQGKTLYTLEALDTGDDLVLSFAIPGDLPSHALSFKDTDGTLRYYAFSTSGKDGALIFEPFQDFKKINA